MPGKVKEQFAMWQTWVAVLSLIVAIGMGVRSCSGTLISAASTVESKASATSVSAIERRITILEVNFQNQKKQLDKIDRKLDKLVEQLK